ncbi:sialidase family protein [Duganella aceris]|jgi:predicted neuraminidase|uniref:Exo-alpha-sialidase n=1 Tax=Duganella aceris TaxID=2703883 RepID=A0ABX0FL75_9BURK|nr:sialidase family protein [Duganella aceris]NGZ85288.1 exo-alpha-sialidase [Duganella aceris]
MGASRPQLQRPVSLVVLACIFAVLAMAATETWRWSRTARHTDAPAQVDTATPPAISLTELSRAMIPMPKGVPSAHASALASLPHGDLIAFWWAGSRESGPDVKVYASRWSEGKWSEQWEVASRESLGKVLGHGVRRIGNPVAWTAADGTVHLYVVATGLGGWAASRVVQMESHDEGASFQVRRLLPMSPVFNTSVLVRAAPVGLADGGWWLPIYFEIGYKYPMLMSFNAQGEPQRLARIGSRKRSLQPTLVPVSATEVRAWMRDNGADKRIQQAVSRDGGQSWEDLGASSMSNQGTSLAVLRLSSGSLVMLRNHGDTRETQRSSLSLWLSNDAQNWTQLADIVNGQPGDEFSYPAMFQVGDELHITYTYQRRAIAHHRLKINLGKDPI